MTTSRRRRIRLVEDPEGWMHDCTRDGRGRVIEPRPRWLPWGVVTCLFCGGGRPV